MEQPRDYASPEPYAFEHYNGVMPEHFGSDDWEDVDLPDDLPAPRSPWRAGAITLLGAAAIAGFALIAWPWKAKAQQMPCAPYGQVSADLASKYGERVVGAGLATPQSMVQLFVSPSGSWTIVSVDTNGLTCIRAAGQDWTPINDTPEPGEGI